MRHADVYAEVLQKLFPKWKQDDKVSAAQRFGAPTPTTPSHTTVPCLTLNVLFPELLIVPVDLSS